MKPRPPRLFQKLLAFVVAFLSLALASLATQTRTNAPATVAPSSATAKGAAATSPVPTNAAPVQAEIPKSVFLIPARPQDGKDPFFPRSMRLFASTSVVVKTNPLPTAAPAPAVELRLNGISGAADHPLAIINNQTFETNEEGEVPTNPGRARIRCLEIKPDSVLVQVGGEQRLLHLRPGS
jgi:hypothetical protein